MAEMHTEINPPRKRIVLVVDDEQINREILGASLEADYRVLYAANGQEALSLLEEGNPFLERYNIVTGSGIHGHRVSRFFQVQ